MIQQEPSAWKLASSVLWRGKPVRVYLFRRGITTDACGLSGICAGATAVSIRSDAEKPEGRLYLRGANSSIDLCLVACYFSS
jgi:hypothetical protein